MSNRGRSRILGAVGLLGLALFFGAPAQAGLISSGGCVDDVTGPLFPNRIPSNCTANDVTFVLVGLGVQSDGCVDGSGDGLSIRLQAVLQNTTAQTRYDVGMYLATDGDPNADGAVTGTCARINIDPVGATGVTTCGVGALDLDGPNAGVDSNLVGIADGTYLSAETGGSNSTPDACGDLFSQGAAGCDEDGDGSWDDTVIDFPSDVQFPCRDIDSDGFVNIPTCATWGNQANNVHDGSGGDTCDSEAELVPGTKAKCRCEDTNTTIPMASLGCSASCSPVDVAPGGTTTCTVTYTNSASCVPDPATPERFRCGTASFLRLKTDYDQTHGSVSGLSTSGSGGGGGALDDGDQIIWTPASTLGTSGIIAQSESATLTFDYTVDLGAPSDITINFSTAGFWADDASFASEVLQTTLTCGASISTPVTLAFFEAEKNGELLSLRWTTATEVGTVGFRVYEELSDGWRRLGNELIPARGGDSTEPRSYAVEVAGASGETFFLESLDADGSTHLHGPFALGESRGHKPLAREIPWQKIRTSAPAAGSFEGVSASASARGSFPEAVLEVRKTGLYRLSYEALAAAGLDFGGARVSHLALTNRGEGVELYVHGSLADSGRFGPGGYLEFFGEALDTLYTTTNIYRLQIEPKAARRVALERRLPRGEAAPYYLETASRELRREYNFGSPFEDPWVDTRMLAFSGSRSFDFEITVEDLTTGAPSRLEIEYWGVTDLPENPDHHVQVLLNGVLLDDRSFDGLAVQSLSLPIPEGLLEEGPNRVTVLLPGDLGVLFDLVNLESLRLSYPRSFKALGESLDFEAAAERFTISHLPSGEIVAYRLEDGSATRFEGIETASQGGLQEISLRGSGQPAAYYLSTVSGLLEPGIRPARPPVSLLQGRADLLVLSHGRFLEALSPWVSYREATGLEVRVVDVADVYDAFSGGILDAKALAEYIEEAAQELGIEGVLLVGGDTYDYRDDLALGSLSFLPSLYARTGEIVRFAPVDPLYTDFDGDQVPDLPIGRWPVRTVEELESIIQRTFDYEAKSYGRRALFVADSFDAGAGVSFTRQSEDLAATLGAAWSSRKAYLDTLSVAEARDVVRGVLEEGAALTSYAGHSAPTSWTFDGLFGVSDVRNLANSGSPTVVVQWGCWNTYFVEPRFETLAHSFLLSGDRGAAAVLGSTTLTESSSAQKLGKILMPLLAEPGRTLGQAVTQAKQELAKTDPDLLDVLLGWTLLGDPLLVIEP